MSDWNYLIPFLYCKQNYDKCADMKSMTAMFPSFFSHAVDVKEIFWKLWSRNIMQ